MFLTIHIILLLFALGSSKDTLSGIQIANGSDIYRIREKPNKMFEIIEPKPKIPTLREIIYFNIKETPFINPLEKEKLPQEQRPDSDKNERPFTNGPGFQFLEFEPIDIHKPNENDKDDSSESDSDSNDSNSESSESSPESHESKNNSNESKNDSDKSSDKEINSHESKHSSHESKNNSKESHNDSKESKNNSKESHNDSKESHNDSKESKNDSKESKNNSKESHNDSKESKNGRKENEHDSKESKNNSNNSNRGNKESNNDSHENIIDTYKSKTDNNIKNKADNDKLKSGSSDADKKNYDKDSENKENYSKDTNKRLDGRSGESENINKNNDISQNTKPSIAIDKSEAENSKKVVRRKRDISYNIPPPPALPPLNVRMLPAFIQRMITNIPALKSMVSPNERGESNDQNVKRPNTYGFHLNNGRGFMWNHLPFINQENYINGPSNMLDKENKEEYQTDNIPDSSSEASSSEPDDNSLDSDNDSGYNPEPEEEEDQSSDETPIEPPNRPTVIAPPIDFNKFKQPITKEKELDNLENKICKDSNLLKQHKPTRTENNIERKKPSYPATNNFYPCNTELTKESTHSPLHKNKATTQVVPEKSIQNQSEKLTKSNRLNKPYKESLNKERKKPSSPATDNFNQCNTEPKSADKCATKTKESTHVPLHKDKDTTPVVPECSIQNQSQEPTKCNHLKEPNKENINKERKKPSSPATDNFNQCNTEPKSSDKCATKAKESTHVPLHKDKDTTPVVPECSIQNKSQEPTKCNHLNEPNKENINKNKDNSDDKKDNEPAEEPLNKLLKKDEFWQWLTKWTAAYIQNLNEHVDELAKKEVAKQVNETLNHENKKEKDKIDTNKNDPTKQNETVANPTTVEPVNNTNEINSNVTTENSIPKTNNTDNSIAPMKEPSNVMNKTAPNGHESNKSTPANPHANNTNAATEKSISENNNTDKHIAPKKDRSNVMNKTLSNGHKSNKTTPAIPNTIYGNAIESDHVTNIFIFYPNAQNNATAKDIEAILGNKSNNVVVLGSPSNNNKESPTADTAAPAKTVTPTDTAAKPAASADTAAKPAAPADTVAPANTAANKTAPADTAPKPAASANTATKPAASADTATKPAAPADTAAKPAAPAGTAAKPAAPTDNAAKT